MLFCFLGLNAFSEPTTRVAKDHQVSASLENREPKTIKDQTITLVAIGDILIHDRVYVDAQSENGYDFKPFLKQVHPYLQKADIMIASQETMIGVTEIGLSSYPSFNSPYEVGDALKDAGVDIVSIANNHTLDRGETAIQNAISHWDKIQMPYVGAFKNSQDQRKLRIIHTDAGISVVFLSYTYGTNGIPVRDGKGYLVNLI
ncbi:CapA family protein [Virgibacillus sp. 179-BFC.A HS]|uniref:CapA family protein n=1 Tax=Tigheibacillus jepli TaxID=3035914 RepID=A0ABU5CM72_9BACI|nr:CapA family protein [Virgibacillus sp. 179-BFC.A HS]MDY0406917.1 CapA family protein [Virgibacillus sp. 179-BFC.A HS]